ncbi:UDP-N-acetylglucosamine 2-epimerase (hydrolyzing) [Clostridium botulinum]|uniref:UDP-N-acetylglucosamine 2-epimerase n=1 Tax=Clostridium botulinum (strain Okra / Type B1) TaxID=498213 RepID=B1IK49_CLOBK|nr:UDP-N-acetylglucosamine 2-epimerase [Clostridium botulinum]EKX81214.1 UDP-N-acetylglucosamine 2-epimerase [Clostridium botulinum CFSAN001628]ACA45790.1 UDP-N-acetylglucosamine 2-epimerase [Clostridium botulinum B1 str. Okra]MBD5562194.1 UDP-N-acetylglucosamine 2-epimerase (hydrolyzing) [Clostridium botulinum]MBD5567149.1 UDP-N-acetylglucosamine 2-epimerase (hydrolyzing) [Clostridium botulinum]MBD5570238.1 UDP-N-acetylglucosamine 2-epimerase (hydrolyzing) [Clostridium botulinum]
MRKVCVVTGTRAEYGLLRNILVKIKDSNNLRLHLVVTGAHLSEDYGCTVDEIESDGFAIDEKLPILMNGNSKSVIAKEMGMLMIQLSQTFERLKPDMLLVLGDRYEIFAATSTAMAMNIPIAHISGGEITEGLVDEQIRHAITKMSHVHFPGAEPYVKNIMNMGEESWRIFNAGDPGIENIKLTKLFNREELKAELNMEVDEDTLLVTYHPVTLEPNRLPYQVENLIKALNAINKKMIVTYPNSDNGSDYIIKKLQEFAKINSNVHLFKNLGITRYLSVMKLCGAVVGNSSSALVEAPYLKVPVVNIGNRQKGRLMAENIISCSNKYEDVVKAVNKALSSEFRERVKRSKSLYGEGNTSEEIVKVLESIEINDELLKKKLVWS